jgi:hypothetical protein
MRCVAENAPAEGVTRALCADLPGAAATWLREAVSASAQPPLDEEAFAIRFAAAARRLGRDPARGAGRDEGAPTRDEQGRAALLLAALSALADEAHVAFVSRLFRRGDLREQRAVLRALPLLPGPERFLPLAVEACRTNVLPVFEAVACESPYPAAHFPEAGFNQLVMKAVFLGLALARIRDLPARWNAELARMAGDLVRERRAAGRPVPADLAALVDGAGGAR